MNLVSKVSIMRSRDVGPRGQQNRRRDSRFFIGT